MYLNSNFGRTAAGILVCCITTWPAALLADDEVKITAVTATYDHDRETTVFKGDVELVSEAVMLTADQVEIKTLEDGNNNITATGNPLEFMVNEADQESASGVADQAVVQYSDDQINLVGNVTFEQGDVVINTHAVVYNWSTGEFQTSQPEDEAKTSPDEGRTTVIIQLQN
ncbi:MAG: lipopolysaccharide transport periplasmic protein LptA [Acidiferrobacterales bacterium]|nr:lipopolysaccharide transport periplasmic protein LptA [Acidiferrobacterales bacterium]